MGHPEPLNLGKLISLETALWQSVVGSSGSDAGSLSPLSLVLCPPTPRKAPATPAPLTLAHLITSTWSIGFYSSPDPQVLGGPHRWRPPEGVPISNLLPNWITYYFQSSCNPSNWSRHFHLIDDFALCAKIFLWSNHEFSNLKSLLLQLYSRKSLAP